MLRICSYLLQSKLVVFSLLWYLIDEVMLIQFVVVFGRMWKGVTIKTRNSYLCNLGIVISSSISCHEAFGIGAHWKSEKLVAGECLLSITTLALNELFLFS